MGDILDRAEKDRNIIEKILHVIPGFSGYLKKEERREADKILREGLARRLEQSRARLDDALRELTDSGGLMHLDKIDRSKKTLEKIVARLRFAAYGYSGFFDTIKVGDEELDRMYQFDLRLTEMIESFEEAVKNLQAAASSSDGIPAQADAAFKLLREFDEHLDGRDKIIGAREE